ncbi:MAG TPA: hypothetical protein VGS57_14305 [Thermoanaerobaculia bacterium]|nr:hypothetical protein [Thermoanaerobaculia bacterium]
MKKFRVWMLALLMVPAVVVLAGCPKKTEENTETMAEATPTPAMAEPMMEATPAPEATPSMGDNMAAPTPSPAAQ